MKHSREERIHCVCGWSGSGYGDDPCPRCGSRHRATSVVAIDPGIQFGRPVVRGTRVTVDVIADLRSAGDSLQSISSELSITIPVLQLALEWWDGYCAGKARRRNGTKQQRRHKRCPRCNQRQRLVDGEIERHMEPPGPHGKAPKECVDNTAGRAGRKG